MSLPGQEDCERGHTPHAVPTEGVEQHCRSTVLFDCFHCLLPLPTEQDDYEKGTFHFLELYASQTSMADHNAAPEIKSFVEKASWGVGEGWRRVCLQGPLLHMQVTQMCGEGGRVTHASRQVERGFGLDASSKRGRLCGQAVRQAGCWGAFSGAWHDMHVANITQGVACTYLLSLWALPCDLGCCAVSCPFTCTPALRHHMD